MRLLSIFFLGLFLTACSDTYSKNPALFYKPEDCNNPAKRSHPDYVAACGNEA